MPESHRHARDFLAAKMGLPPLSGEKLSSEQLKEIENENWETQAAREAMTQLAGYYCRQLKNNPKLLSWVRQEYGFSDEIIDLLQIGYADNGSGVDANGQSCKNSFHAMSNSGNDPARLLLSSTFHMNDSKKMYPFFRKRIVFPYWSRGQVVFMIGRQTPWTASIPSEKPKYKKLPVHDKVSPPYVARAVHNGYFYNEDCLLRRPKQVLITEGVTDCISAMQCGIPAISPVTTTFRKEDIARLVKLLNGVEQVVICNDSESSGAGERGALKTAAALHKAGVAVRIATIPLPKDKEKIDVNELVAAQGAEALKDVVEKATPYINYLIEKISPDTDKAELDRHLEPILTQLANTEPIARQSYIDEMAERFNVPKRVLSTYLKSNAAGKERPERSARESPSSRPEIQINQRQLADIVKETSAILCESNRERIEAVASGVEDSEGIPIVFSRSDCLVRLHQEENNSPSITAASQDAVLAIMTWIADWYQLSRQYKRVPVFPPKDVARDLMTMVPKKLPVLESVITTPIFGFKGDLILTPGYHAGDRIWMQPDSEVANIDIPTAPKPYQVQGAKALILDDLLVDFPFVKEADRTAILAALFLPFARRLISGSTPIHLIEAPTPGAGKTKLCDLISIIATGHCCHAQTLPTIEEEIRKKLTSELFSAQPIILLDNAKGRRIIDSNTLAAILTTDIWKDRLLGQSAMISMKNLALWMLTANNPLLSNEITRRCIRIRLDPKEDRPWQRTGFKHDPIIEWAKANRKRLLRAVLTMIQSWVAESMPLGEQRLGSFENWAAVMSGIFDVLEIPGFLGNLDAFYAAADNEGEMWRDFTATWWTRFRTETKRVAELNDFAEQSDLMQIVRGDGTERSQQIRLGKALHNARDRVFGDFCIQLVRDRGPHKGKYYALKKTNELQGENQRKKCDANFNYVDNKATEEVDPFCKY
jgi:DNA primase